LSRRIADQGKVWDEVASGNRRTGTGSATGAMRDACDAFGAFGVAGAALMHEDIIVHASLFRRRERSVSGPMPF